MPNETTIASLHTKARRLLNLISTFNRDESISKCLNELRRLIRNLESLSLGSIELGNDLESQFYFIIESDFRVRKASQIVFKEELLDICNNGFDYFRNIENVRPLSGLEEEQRRVVLNEARKLDDEIHAIRDELMEYCNHE